MKLIELTAATLAAIKAQEMMGDDINMGDENMIEEEQPWWMMLEHLGFDIQDTEQRTVFKLDDPKIYYLHQKDGKKVNLKTPWYNRKYEIVDKETSHQFAFKETVPAYNILNEVDYKVSSFNKNEKSIDPDCTNSNPKKCEIKTPVGLQNKFEYDARHRSPCGDYKVNTMHNYVHDLEMKPTSFLHRSGWDYSYEPEEKPEGEEMPMEGTEIMEMNNGSMMMMGTEHWHSKGQCEVKSEWEYQSMEDPNTGEMHEMFKKFSWEVTHSQDHSGAEPWEMEMMGSSEVKEMNFDEEAKTAGWTIDYETQCNMGWSNIGTVTESVENYDSCMEMGEAFYNMDMTALMTGFLETPCIMNWEVEGVMTNEEGETPYNMGHRVSISSMFHWNIDIMENDEWMPFFALMSNYTLTDEVEMTGETTTTVQCQGNDLFTINWEQMQAHCNMKQEMMSKMMYNMYAEFNYFSEQWQMMDWESEETMGQFVATVFNYDYVIRFVGDMQAGMVREMQEMECAYPHWETMKNDMGIEIHPYMQEMMYQCVSKHLQQAQLGEEIKYWMHVELSQYLYATDGSMSYWEIQQSLAMMDYSEQYRWIADMLESGMFEIYTENCEFMYRWLEMEMPSEEEMMAMTEEEMEQAKQTLHEMFMNSLPTVEDLRAIATQIDEFQPVEQTHEEIDTALNTKCNAQFDELLAMHSMKVEQHASCVETGKETATYWSQKHVEWLTTPREEVEAMFDQEFANIQSMKDGIWDCEWQIFAAPMKKVWSETSEECQSMLMDKYPGIDAWEHDGVMEEDMSLE